MTDWIRASLNTDSGPDTGLYFFLHYLQVGYHGHVRVTELF